MAILINDLITSIEVELEAEERQAAKAVNEAKLILKQAGDEGRANLSPEEDVRVNELFVARDQSKRRIGGIKAKLEQARKAAVEEAEEREAQATETAHPRRVRGVPPTTRPPASAASSAPTTRKTTAKASGSSATSPATSCSTTPKRPIGSPSTWPRSASNAASTSNGPPATRRPPTGPV